MPLPTKTEEKVTELKDNLISTDEIKRMNYRLSDAIREGSTVTNQAEGWGDGENACALHSAVIAAKARGFIND